MQPRTRKRKRTHRISLLEMELKRIELSLKHPKHNQPGTGTGAMENDEKSNGMSETNANTIATENER